MIRLKARKRRRGLGTTEMVLVLAAVCIAVVIGVAAVGNSTRDEINATAEDVGDPSELAKRFHDNPGQ